MVTRVRQNTGIPRPFSSVKINNNFPRKRVSVKNLPRGSKIHVDSSFIKPEKLKGRMSKIRASAQFKSGQIKAKTKLQTMRIKQNQKVTVNIS